MGASYSASVPTIATGNPTVLDHGDQNIGTHGVEFDWTLEFSFGSGNSSITREMEATWDAITDATVFRHVSTQSINAPAGCTIHSIQNHRGDVAYSPSGTLTSTYDYDVTSEPSASTSYPLTHTKTSSSTTPHVSSATIYLLKDWGSGYEYCSSWNCSHLDSVVFFPITMVLD